MPFFQVHSPTKPKVRFADLQHIKPLYEAFQKKHSRLKQIVGRPADLEEFEAQKVDLDTINALIMKNATSFKYERVNKAQ